MYSFLYMESSIGLKRKPWIVRIIKIQNKTNQKSRFPRTIVDERAAFGTCRWVVCIFTSGPAWVRSGSRTVRPPGPRALLHFVLARSCVFLSIFSRPFRRPPPLTLLKTFPAFDRGAITAMQPRRPGSRDRQRRFTSYNGFYLFGAMHHMTLPYRLCPLRWAIGPPFACASG